MDDIDNSDLEAMTDAELLAELARLEARIEARERRQAAMTAELDQVRAGLAETGRLLAALERGEAA